MRESAITALDLVGLESELVDALLQVADGVGPVVLGLHGLMN